MGDFTYLGRETLVRAKDLIASADAAFVDGRIDDALAPLGVLLDECFGGGGSGGPDDGAVDQLVSVVAALRGDEDEEVLRDEWADDNEPDPGRPVPQVSWERFLQSYALDDLRNTIDWSIAEIDVGRGV